MHLYSSQIGAVHLFAASAALALGLIVLVLRKGTALHRATGLCYAAAMLTVNGTALMLYHLTGRFDVFHALALLSLGMILWGVAAAIFRWNNWLYAHYRAMSFSYIGLLSAACAEAMTRLPILQVRSATMAITVGVAIAVLFGIVGGFIVVRLKPAVLAAAQLRS